MQLIARIRTMTAKKRRKLVSVHESSQGCTISLLCQLLPLILAALCVVKDRQVAETHQGAAAGGCQPSLIDRSMFSRAPLLRGVMSCGFSSLYSSYAYSSVMRLVIRSRQLTLCCSAR
jgi:hypothetical protein